MRIRYAAGIYIAVALIVLAGNIPALVAGKSLTIFAIWSISVFGGLGILLFAFPGVFRWPSLLFSLLLSGFACLSVYNWIVSMIAVSHSTVEISVWQASIAELGLLLVAFGTTVLLILGPKSRPAAK